MGHNKPFGSSPETEESLPTKLVGKVTEGAHEAISSLWDQMIGAGDYKTSPHDAKSAHSPHDATSSNQENQAQHASEAKTSNLIEGVLFQLGAHNQDKYQQNPENHLETRRAGNDYHREIVDAGKDTDTREQRQIRQKIEQILNELRGIVISVKVLENHFTDVTVAPPPQKPGKYHENFFDWLLIMVKQARQKVENSSSWLGAVQGKGKNKKGYWDRAEKEGTTFTQNNERSAATSVG